MEGLTILARITSHGPRASFEKATLGIAPGQRQRPCKMGLSSTGITSPLLHGPQRRGQKWIFGEAAAIGYRFDLRDACIRPIALGDRDRAVELHHRRRRDAHQRSEEHTSELQSPYVISYA